MFGLLAIGDIFLDRELSQSVGLGQQPDFLEKVRFFSSTSSIVPIAFAVARKLSTVDLTAIELGTFDRSSLSHFDRWTRNFYISKVTQRIMNSAF